MPVLISELIWQPIGANEDADMTLDLFRTPIYNGGVCATLQGGAWSVPCPSGHMVCWTTCKFTFSV